ncbi:MAG: prolipoprotein diacylglyceryl transferase [Candidatus Adiutrix sp.]|jgi:phosphatidylglycerol:prolipoprotein diacylglycerol transferase|nr:prolipoprotein diacylglyceryl transferase [Candidatus Adiutrix sp.]
MWPGRFELVGPLALSFYGLAVALGVLAGLLLLSLTAPRRGLESIAVWNFSFWMVLAGLIGSRLAYVAFHWPEFEGQWVWALAYWRGGLMFQGGLAGALLVSPVFLKKEGLAFWPAFDVLAPSLALGQAFGRLGCLSAGCCYGRPLEPGQGFGLTFPPGSQAPADIPLWPTQAVESFFLAILALGLVAALRAPRFRRPGRVAALYLAGAGAIRLVMEFFRGDFRGEPLFSGLPPTTLAAALTLVLGLALLPGARPWSFK